MQFLRPESRKQVRPHLNDRLAIRRERPPEKLLRSTRGKVLRSSRESPTGDLQEPRLQFLDGTPMSTRKLALYCLGVFGVPRRMRQ